MTLRTILAINVGLAMACSPFSFTGDEGEVLFSSNLSHDVATWSPATGVATGSHVRIDAVDPADCPLLDDDDGIAPCQIISGGFSVDRGEDLLDPQTTLVGGSITTVLLAPGDVGLRWHGQIERAPAGVQTVDDSFTLAIADAIGVELRDPLRTYLLHADWPLEQGSVWPELDAPLALAVGPAISLEVVLRSGGGNDLAYASDEEGEGPDVSTSTTSPCLSVESAGAFTHLTAVEDAEGCTGEVTVLMRDTPVAALPVEIVDPAAISRVELAATLFSDWYGLKATALLADGRELLQPPLDWQVDDGVEVVKLTDLCNLGITTADMCEPGAVPGENGVPDRRDVLLVKHHVAASGETPTVERQVTVGFGQVQAATTLTFDDSTFEEPPAPPPTEPSCACATASAAGMPWLAAVLALWPARRRRIAAKRMVFSIRRGARVLHNAAFVSQCHRRRAE